MTSVQLTALFQRAHLVIRPLWPDWPGKPHARWPGGQPPVRRPGDELVARGSGPPGRDRLTAPRSALRRNWLACAMLPARLTLPVLAPVPDRPAPPYTHALE